MGLAMWNLRCKKCGNLLVWTAENMFADLYTCLGCRAEVEVEKDEIEESAVDEVMKNLYHPPKTTTG